MGWIDPRLIRPQDWSPRGQDTADEERLVQQLLASEGLAHHAQLCVRFYSDKKVFPQKEVSGLWSPWHRLSSLVSLLQECVPQLPLTLQEPCRSLIVQADRLEALNERWGQALANYLHIPVSAAGMDYPRLRKKLDNRRRRAGPIWLTQANFQQLLAETQAIASATEEAWLQLRRNLMGTYPHLVVTDADFGDQRAKDLIDLAVGESNPRKAIKLLQRALRYGQTGIQASKAYLVLGNQYADLGDVDQAIASYSRSVEAWRDPLPMAIYWRGELYFRQNRRDEARRDFERVLEFGIWSPEREKAAEYLSLLREK